MAPVPDSTLPGYDLLRERVIRSSISYVKADTGKGWEISSKDLLAKSSEHALDATTWFF